MDASIYFRAVRRAFPLLALLVVSACTVPTQFASAPADPGKTTHDPRLIGNWLWTEGRKIGGFVRLSTTDNGQVAIEFHKADGQVLELSGYASDIEGSVFYIVTPDTGSYFRFFKAAKDVPGHMLARVEFVNDDEGYVWISMWGEASVPDGWSANKLTLAENTSGVLVTVSQDTLRAALRDDPYRVVNFRLGPYYRVPTGRQSPSVTFWLSDKHSQCAVGFGKSRFSIAGEVTWSGACRDGKANGFGLLELKNKGTLQGRFEGTLVDGLPHGVGRCSDAKSSDWKTCQFEFGQEVKTAK